MEKVIEIRDFEFSYNRGSCALKDINLNVLKGEVIGIVGANGAGKSTLLLSMVGCLEGKGELVISGMKIGKKNLGEIRKKIGFVFQNPDDQLFSTTVFDDVAFGPLNLELSFDEIKKRVQRALKAVEMEGFENHLPHHLSIGEKKRIAIATVLSMEPEILILDEPSSGLDSGLRRKLINLLEKFQTTIVIASHDLDLIAQLCKRVYILNRGEIIGEGACRETLSNEALMTAAGLEPLRS